MFCMEKEEQTMSIDDKEKTVSITLNPRLYPQSVIMRAAYRFTEDFDVVVDGDPLDKITAAFRVRKEDKKDATRDDLAEVANTFYNELLHASVEETQARRYADTRNALIGAALGNMVQGAIKDAKKTAGNTK